MLNLCCRIAAWLGGLAFLVIGVLHATPMLSTFGMGIVMISGHIGASKGAKSVETSTEDKRLERIKTQYSLDKINENSLEWATTMAVEGRVFPTELTDDAIYDTYMRNYVKKVKKLRGKVPDGGQAALTQQIAALYSIPSHYLGPVNATANPETATWYNVCGTSHPPDCFLCNHPELP